MKQAELKQLLGDISRVRLAIVGDYCLDAYWFLDDAASELSVETGLRTRAVLEQRYSLGGAGNVVMNLHALGVQSIRAFGVIGIDPFGQEMLRLLQQAGVETEGVLIQRQHWSTHVYTKPYLADVEQNRIDFGNYNRLEDAIADELLRRLEAALPLTDVIIINEQVASGIHCSEYFRKGLQTLISRNVSRTFLLDSRNFSDAYAATVRKINANEAARLCGIKRAPDELVLHTEARQAAETLSRRWQKPAFISRGPRGCIVCDSQGLHEIPGLQILGRIDPVGAGDSMLAGIAAAMAAGRDNLTAAKLGNFVAGVTVQKLFQTGTASPEEIMAIGSDPDYIYRPELAEDPRQARYLAETEIEIISSAPSHESPITHAIFDNDGTISTLRQGWERIMEPMMIRAVLGDRFQDADESLYQKVVQRVRDFIDKTTGIQTISQMEGLVGIVREFKCVLSEQVLSAAGYKAIYNQSLMNLVRERIAKLQRSELAVEDFTLKNAVLFLEVLHQSGVHLYLASGTDEQDVIAEAEALGYAHFFERRIYGSVGDLAREAKRVVLERILNDIGPGKARHVAAFGDGPVEIRETNKMGGYSIGVASDEVRRFGLNPEKRARLIRAGADMIIPDYSQMERVLALFRFGPA